MDNLSLSITIIATSICCGLFIGLYEPINRIIRLKKLKKIIAKNKAKEGLEDIERTLIGDCIKEDNPFVNTRDLIINTVFDKDKQMIYYQYTYVTLDENGFIVDSKLTIYQSLFSLNGIRGFDDILNKLEFRSFKK